MTAAGIKPKYRESTGIIQDTRYAATFAMTMARIAGVRGPGPNEYETEDIEPRISDSSDRQAASRRCQRIQAPSSVDDSNDDGVEPDRVCTLTTSVSRDGNVVRRDAPPGMRAGHRRSSRLATGPQSAEMAED
jgi:hypothetical protein